MVCAARFFRHSLQPPFLARFAHTLSSESKHVSAHDSVHRTDHLRERSRRARRCCLAWRTECPVYSTGSTVSVTYLGGPAADNDALYWFLAPGSSTNQLLLTNHGGMPGPTTINHVFTSGSEVVFGLQDNSGHFLFCSGDPSRNSDGLAHFWVDMIAGNTLRATMTDLPGQNSNDFKSGGGFQGR